VAIYKYTRYGTERYGPVVIDWSLYGATGTNLPLTSKFVDFEVDPIVAEPMGYDLISLTWQSPSGIWTGLRVLKNFTGYSVNETDGEILLDVTAPDHSLIDSGVRAGAWHYYTLFVQSEGVWQRAGGTSTLMVVNHGYGQRLFDHLPAHHQTSGTDANDSPIENETLKKFLNVLGWGLDYVKTNLDSLQFLNDPKKSHINDLARLADQLGITYEASAPSALFRQRVGSAAVLGREKGTLEQLQSLISMTTSLDVELSLSPNRMVNDDAATFVHPVYPLYTTFLNYASGERIRFNGYVYQCNTGGAYGQAQAPPGTQASNTWWTNLANTTDVTLVDADGAIAGWEPTHYSGALNPTLVLALGVQSVQSATDLTSNALKVSNATGSTADLGARSIAKRLGETTTDRGQVFKFGAPIPLPLPYLDTDNYQRDTLVNFDGKVYRATHEVMGIAPSGGLIDDGYWESIGLDDRVNLAVSLYAKAGAGFIIPAYPVIEFFDQLGALVATVDTEKESTSGSTFDSFGNRFGTLVGRTLDTGGMTWTVPSGTWTVSDLAGGVLWPLTTGLITVPGSADGNVSATFDAAAVGTNKQFVTFRGDTTTFLKATRTALYSSMPGTDTLLGSYSTPFSDNDRITVNFIGTEITVMRNGVSVLGVTSTFNQTATLHGLGVA
jgi:hypothetical protein